MAWSNDDDRRPEEDETEDELDENVSCLVPLPLKSTIF
jgi:hypothetical protein